MSARWRSLGRWWMSELVEGGVGLNESYRLGGGGCSGTGIKGVEEPKQRQIGEAAQTTAEGVWWCCRGETWHVGYD